MVESEKVFNHIFTLFYLLCFFGGFNFLFLFTCLLEKPVCVAVRLCVCYGHNIGTLPYAYCVTSINE